MIGALIYCISKETRRDVIWTTVATLIAVAGGVIRLALAWLPMPTLLAVIVSDDAFYYFTIARNISSGAGVTFDGERVTNGFHPLWLLVITPIVAALHDPWLVVHVALTFSALLGAITAMLVFVAVVRLTNNSAAGAGATALYALHPYIAAESVNGLETQLALTLFMCTLLMCHRLWRMSPADRRGVDYALLGVLVGLTLLARTDMVIALTPVLIGGTLLSRGHPRRAVWAPVGATLVVAPWAVWMFRTFGTLVQVSGIAISDFTRRDFVAAHGDALGPKLAHSLEVTLRALTIGFPDHYLAPWPWLRLPTLVALVVVGVLVVRAQSPEQPRIRAALALLALPASGVVATLLYHTAVRWHVREWYFAPVAVLLVLGVGIALAALDATRRHGGQAAGPALMVACVALAVLCGPWQAHAYLKPLPHKVNMYATARWMADNLPQNARIGSFNAGVLGYFSGRRVVNLDGVVNEAAFRARMAGRMTEFVCVDERLDHLVDLNIASQWNYRECPGDPCHAFIQLTTIGIPLPYFRGGRLDVLAKRSVTCDDPHL